MVEGSGSSSVDGAAVVGEGRSASRALFDLVARLGTRFYIVVAAAGLLTAVLIAVFEPNFYRSQNQHVLMQQVSVLGLVTLGQLLVLLVAGIDLSVGAVMNATLIVKQPKRLSRNWRSDQRTSPRSSCSRSRARAA
jgi:ribose transport system permease protein